MSASVFNFPPDTSGAEHMNLLSAPAMLCNSKHDRTSFADPTLVSPESSPAYSVQVCNFGSLSLPCVIFVFFCFACHNFDTSYDLLSLNQESLAEYDNYP